MLPSERPPGHLTGRQAAALLGVKTQTLYAYVSRGLIRSAATPGSTRRLYARADVEKLKARSQARSGHGPAAAAAMHWGEPIIPTSITEIAADGPRYRGRGAVDLARSGRLFENVAEFLWTGRDFERPIAWELQRPPADIRRFTRALDEAAFDKPLSQSMSIVALGLGLTRGSPAERVRSSTTVIAARQLLQALTGCFGYARARPGYVEPRPGESIAESILRASGLAPSPERLRGVNAMMVLLADHELSPATFAARIAASSGADLHACIVAAIETGSGAEIAHIYDRIAEFLAGASSRSELMRRHERLQELGNLLPGFNHPLYPTGDPRTGHLMELAKAVKRPAVRLGGFYDFLDEAKTKLDLHPRIEIGVFALSAALGFPSNAPAGLYALARVAGWVAHILEQRLSAALLRPRARFIGNGEASVR